jgi:hypothetical protein
MTSGPAQDPRPDPEAPRTPMDVISAALAGSARVHAAPTPRRPLYWRLLHLRHIEPNAWQRALFAEGSLLLAGLLVLADMASAWLLLVLPVTVAAVVKAHDVVDGMLLRAGR